MNSEGGPTIRNHIGWRISLVACLALILAVAGGHYSRSRLEPAPPPTLEPVTSHLDHLAVGEEREFEVSMLNTSNHPYRFRGATWT